MKITRITLYRYDIPLKAPIAISLGTIEHARNMLVQIDTDEGLTGWGEGSPFWMIVGETQASGLAAGGDMARLLLGRDPVDIGGCVDALVRYLPGHPTTRSSFDMALYDLAAKQANLPLYAYLGGAKRPLVTDETIYINTPERMAEDAVRIYEQGAVAIKIKLGTNAKDDIDRLYAIEKALAATYPERSYYNVPYRLDANQGWSHVTASEVLYQTRFIDHQFQYCEQPVRRAEIHHLAKLKAEGNVPIMADESLFDAQDALRLVREGAVDYFNIKLSKSGGIWEALKINTIGETAGIPCMIGCMSESRLALTANAHFASARPNVVFCDLDACFEHALDPVEGGIQYRNHYHIDLPDAPGIGATVEPEFLKQCEKVIIA
ncbi:MAG: dipeptide epimerase [Cytophagales bacterium]|nr:MAG: dipeptide epimerase [Cytophagales bacterium]